MHTQHARVLVVEDEAVVALDIKNRLRRSGYTVVGTAATQAEAMEQAAVQSPDVVLMDIMLRDRGDGITTAQVLRDVYDVPAIY